MNLHVKELGNVIMWTIGHFKENVKRIKILLLPQKTWKNAIKIWKPDYTTSLTHKYYQ